MDMLYVFDISISINRKPRDKEVKWCVYVHICLCSHICGREFQSRTIKSKGRVDIF